MNRSNDAVYLGFPLVPPGLGLAYLRRMPLSSVWSLRLVGRVTVSTGSMTACELEMRNEY